MNGFTGSGASHVEAVHRGEMVAPCSCGGLVYAYDDGEFIAHTEPFDKDVEHRVEAFGLFPAWKYVE